MAVISPDPAAAETDRIIEEIEKRIKVEYTQAEREIKNKLDDYMRRFQTKDKIWQKWVSEGKRTQAEYDHWRVGQIAIGKRWEEMKETISQDLLNTSKIAKSIAMGYMPEVYALNHDYGTFQVEHGSMIDTSYSLYDRQTAERMFRDNPQMMHAPGKKVSQAIADGKAVKWNNQHIQSVMMQTLLQGDSIPDVATRLSNAVGDTDRKAATRNARTMVTGAQNAGRVDSYKRANDLGIETKKQWLATLDSRTRHAHRQLDGVSVPNDEPFQNEFGKIMYPGDPTAAAANVYNCRCTLIASIKGHERDLSNPNLRHNKNLGKMTYEEWKAEKESTSNPILLPEKKSENIRAGYIREYKGFGGQVESGLDRTLDIDSRFVEEAPEPVFNVVNGNDISGTWQRRPDEFDFEIEDIINAQGFDGKPRVVSRAEFDEAVKAANGGNGFIAQRVYGAPGKDVAEAYRDELYNGKWYVDCSTGGSMYGKGMYTASDYSGELSDGIKKEMENYAMINKRRIIEEDDDYIRELNEWRNTLPRPERSMLNDYKTWGMVDPADKDRVNQLIEEENKIVNKHYYSITETLTLDPSAKIITYNDLDTMRGFGTLQKHLVEQMDISNDDKNIFMKWIEDEGDVSDLPNHLTSIGSMLEERSDMLMRMDRGSLATALGYDAINVGDAGSGGCSYTIILNRTKVIFLGE